jgi:hypothetical protein
MSNSDLTDDSGSGACCSTESGRTRQTSPFFIDLGLSGQAFDQLQRLAGR